MSRTMILTLVTASSAALALALPSEASRQARPAHADPAAVFDRTDANKDGKVTRAEYVAARSARFGDLDKNKDGVVSKADFPRAAANPQAAAKLDAMIGEADANKDGKVTKAELDKAPAPGFDRVDTNKDGVVTKAELDAARAAATAARAKG
jgi:hypothetical protein